ncbi:hypothetical protein [Peribacillus alkalitolerans]|uniref:hypothetical protein n=1 Tax=Peribacillus alkalitolerans TaxID=1550385 RepID=UPI0013D565B4|nr:hypothetical protein [Peribacillus alkalitolerans]
MNGTWFGKLQPRMIELKNKGEVLFGETKKKMENFNVSVPLTESMILYLLKKSSLEGVSNLEVKMHDEILVISGIMKKTMLAIPFEVGLKPVSANGRILTFLIESFRPLNSTWIKKKIFDKEPFASYNEGKFSLDLNGLEKIKAIPFGSIVKFNIKDQKLWIGIGK